MSDNISLKRPASEWLSTSFSWKPKPYVLLSKSRSEGRNYDLVSNELISLADKKTDELSVNIVDEVFEAYDVIL